MDQISGRLCDEQVAVIRWRISAAAINSDAARRGEIARCVNFARVGVFSQLLPLTGANRPPRFRWTGAIHRHVAALGCQGIEQTGDGQIRIASQVVQRKDDMPGRHDIFADIPVIPVVEGVAPLTPPARYGLQLVCHRVEAKITSRQGNRLRFRMAQPANDSTGGARRAIDLMVDPPDKAIFHVFHGAEAKTGEDLVADAGFPAAVVIPEVPEIAPSADKYAPFPTGDAARTTKTVNKD